MWAELVETLIQNGQATGTHGLGEKPVGPLAVEQQLPIASREITDVVLSQLQSRARRQILHPDPSPKSPFYQPTHQNGGYPIQELKNGDWHWTLVRAVLLAFADVPPEDVANTLMIRFHYMAKSGRLSRSRFASSNSGNNSCYRFIYKGCRPECIKITVDNTRCWYDLIIITGIKTSKSIA